MSEISDFATIVLVVSGGFALAILSTRLSGRLPIPAPVIFLVAAALISDAFPDLRDAVSVKTVERIAVGALVVILLNGGMDIGWRRLRESAGPVLSLGILGTFVTAGLAALAAHVLLGFDWVLAGVVGAALAPTDPAVTFSVLGRREIAGRAGTVLEGEAGVNDPAGIALMIGMIELATHADATFLVVVEEFVVEMAVGAALGFVVARLLVPALRHVHLGVEGLYPAFVLTLAALLYAVTSVAGGSGFLAVFVLGLVLGDAAAPYKLEIERFHGSLASLAEVVVFIALGLTIDITDFSGKTWLDGAVLAVFLAMVARPVAVALTLAGARIGRQERAFIAWSGLKGAVPILLAAFAILSSVEGAGPIYDVVFVVVALSVLVQGTLVPTVAQRLRIAMHERSAAQWGLYVPLGADPEGAYDFRVQRGSPADGRTARELGLHDDDWVIVVVRDGDAHRPDEDLRLREGDVVYVLADPAREAAVSALFA
jgi:cell volume regulation protein A